jgi:hypothetical protein
MGSWLYKWEDGTFSLVCAPTRDDAIFMLEDGVDQVRDPKRLKPLGKFMVTLRLEEHLAEEWLLDSVDEATSDHLFAELNKGRGS